MAGGGGAGRGGIFRIFLRLLCLAPHQPSSQRLSPLGRGSHQEWPLLSCGLQIVLLLSVLCPTLVVFDLSFLPTELVVGPFGAGAGFPKHEPAPAPGKGSSAPAPAHPLLTAFAFTVVMQVILLAFGRVLRVPLLLPVSLLKIVVAAVVVVTRVVTSAPASPSGSKLKGPSSSASSLAWTHEVFGPQS